VKTSLGVQEFGVLNHSFHFSAEFSVQLWIVESVVDAGGHFHRLLRDNLIVNHHRLINSCTHADKDLSPHHWTDNWEALIHFERADVRQNVSSTHWLIQT